MADPPVTAAAAAAAAAAQSTGLAQATSVTLEEPRSPLLEAENFTSPDAAHRQASHAAPNEPSEPQQAEIPSYLRPTAASVNRCTLGTTLPVPPRRAAASVSSRYTATPPPAAASRLYQPLKPPLRHTATAYVRATGRRTDKRRTVEK